MRVEPNGQTFHRSCVSRATSRCVATDPAHEDGFKKKHQACKRGGYKADKTNPETLDELRRGFRSRVPCRGSRRLLPVRRRSLTCIDLDVKDKDSHPDKPHPWTSS
ncbi:hypothetical protein [Stenotrophomonas phage CM2]